MRKCPVIRHQRAARLGAPAGVSLLLLLLLLVVVVVFFFLLLLLVVVVVLVVCLLCAVRWVAPRHDRAADTFYMLQFDEPVQLGYGEIRTRRHFAEAATQKQQHLRATQKRLGLRHGTMLCSMAHNRFIRMFMIMTRSITMTMSYAYASGINDACWMT